MSFGPWFLLVLAFAPPSRVGNEELHEIFDDPRYRFCDPESDEVVIERERAWCDLLSSSDRVCPGFSAACEREQPKDERASVGEPSEDEGGQSTKTGRESGDALRERPNTGESKATPRDPPQQSEAKAPGSGTGRERAESGERSGERATPSSRARERLERRAPEETKRAPREPRAKKAEPEKPKEEAEVPALGLASRILLWALLAMGIAAIVYSIVRNVSSRRRSLEKTGDTPSPEPVAVAAPAPVLPRETDVDRLLARAQDAARRGDFPAGIADAYAALLRSLESAGKIEVRPFRTNGDYLAQLRSSAELRASVRDVVRDVERVQFGGKAAEPSTFSRVFERVSALVRGTMVVVLLAAGIVACDEGSQSLTGFGYHPHGLKAVGELLGDRGIDMHHHGQSLELLGASTEVLLVFGDADATPEEWAAIAAWVEQGGRLVLATNATDFAPELDLRTEIGPATVPSPLLYDDDRLVLRLRVPSESALLGPHPSVLLFRAVELDELDALDAFAVAEETYAARLFRGEGSIDVFADDYLFTNAAMTVDDNAAWVVEHLAGLAEEGAIAVVDGSDGVGASGPLESLRRAFLTPLFLQILALVALLFAWRGRAFGRLVDPPTNRRRAFVDHVRALGSHYARAGAGRHVARLYAAWAMERLRKRVPRGTSGLHGLAVELARRTGQDETRIMRLLLAAHELREGQVPTDYGAGVSGAAHSFMGVSARGRAELRTDLSIVRDLTALLLASQGRSR